jgi:hypothetical protein
MTSTPLDPLDPNTDLEGAIRELVGKVGQLLEQGSTVIPVVAALEETIARRARAFWAAVVIGSVLVLLLAGVALDNRSQVAALKRQFCPVVQASITQPGGTPPSTQHGRDVEAAMRRLAGHFGCASA